MDKQSRFADVIGRRAATIEGQLRGIERLLQKNDIQQMLTQSSAARNALDSLVMVILEAAVVDRFAIASLCEEPEEAFERALERAMTYWFSCTARQPEKAAFPADESDFWTTARRHTRAIEDGLRSIRMVLEGRDYLRSLRELGALRCEIDDLMKQALYEFMKERAPRKHGSVRARQGFERIVAQALKYWHLPDPRVPVAMPTGLRWKILVVDDDPDVVDYVTCILEKHSYDVVTASDAVEAMTAVESEKPDLIVLDVMMPSGTEGFHFTWRLRARPEPEYRNIPIIVLSAIHDTTSLRFYPEEGDGVYAPGEFLPVEAFIDKPVDEEKLAGVVERVLAAVRRDTVHST